PDANSSNSQISYYLKGELISLLLDLLIRQRHDNRRSLDDVMRQMWQQFGQPEIGFTPEQLQSVIQSVAETELEDFFQRFIHGIEELPFDEYLNPFGLQLRAEIAEDSAPHLGLTVKAEKGITSVKFVEANSPAQHSGIDAGDELLAINGFRVNAEQLQERLKDYQPGDSINLTVFHQDALRTCSVTLGPPPAKHFQIQVVEHPSSTQAQNFAGWLGQALADI
ncbi:MAG TPA: PDZ domain-containing protein, partial [Candidatus Caenarcaniphilales bacterium]